MIPTISIKNGFIWFDGMSDRDMNDCIRLIRSGATWIPNVFIDGNVKDIISFIKKIDASNQVQNHARSHSIID